MPGHNQPPDLLTVLSEDYAPLRHEVEKLAERANVAPRAIKAPADLDAIGGLLKDVRALARTAKTAHATAKDPYLSGGRVVDQFFKTLTDRLIRIDDVFQKIADDHARAVAAAARAKAAAEAKAAREEEARRLEAAMRADEENRNKHAQKHTAKADEARQAAEDAEAVAEAPAKDVVRTMTTSGIAAGARTDWDFEVVDFDAIDLNRLRPLFKREHVEQAIRQAVKNGAREITGVRVFENVTATFR